MDRCRCAEYAAAVEKLRFYTVGTYRPDVIDNFDRSGYLVSWGKHGVDYEDLRFVIPQARKELQPHELPENRLSSEARKIDQMWCPFMTPYKVVPPEEN